MNNIKAALQKALETSKQEALRKTVAEWDDEPASAPAPVLVPVPTSKQINITVKAPMQPTPVPKPNWFKPTNNVTRNTFDIVHDNPGITYRKAVDTLAAEGYNRNSVASILGVMIRQRTISRDKDKRMTTLVKEYVPPKGAFYRATPKAAPKAKAAPVQKKVETAAGIASLSTSPAPRVVTTPAQPVAQPLAPVPTLLTAKQVLETLSIKEAHMLYRELQTMFGN